MFDSWFIGIGGGILLLCTVAIVYWLKENDMVSFIGYVIATTVFIVRSSVLRSGSTTSADIMVTRGIEENRGTLDFLSDQFNWTLFFMVLASLWVVWDKVLPHFINKHFKITFTLPVDNISANAKPTLSVVRNEQVTERKRA